MSAAISEAPSVVIGLSNLSLSPRDLMTRDASGFTAALLQGGYDTDVSGGGGFEWSDVRIPSVRAVANTLARLGLVSVVHESWLENRGEYTGDEVRRSWEDDTALDPVRKVLHAGQSALAAAGASLVLPRLDQCYPQLAGLQRTAGHRLPIIVHPEGQFLNERPPSRPRNQLPRDTFDELWYQPTPEWASAHGVPLDAADVKEIAAAIIAAQTRQGLDGVVIDLHHFSSVRNGKQFADWKELAIALAQDGSMREVQLAVRPDFGGKADTLRQICDGKLSDTDPGNFLIALSKAIPLGRTIRLVVEIAAGEIKGKTGATDYLSVHAVITESVRRIFANAGQQQGS